MADFAFEDENLDILDYSRLNGGNVVVYAQEVRSTNEGICTWQSSVLTSSPASGITTPPWTGALVAGQHTVIGAVV